MSADSALQNGAACHQAGRLDEAEAHYRAVLREDPGQPDALHLLGVLLAQRGQSGPARALLERAVALRPDAVEMRANLARLLRQSGEAEAACSHLQHALGRAPDRADLRRSLASVLLHLGRPAEAAGHWQTLLAAGQGTAGDAINLGVALRQDGRIDAAIRHYVRLAEQLPADARVRFNLGNALRDAGQTAAAVTRYLETLHLQPEHPEAWLNLGAIYQQRGEAEHAETAYRLALEHQPALADAWLNLATLLSERGQRPAAARACADGLAHCPGHARLALERAHHLQHLCQWAPLEALLRDLRMHAGPADALDPFAVLALPDTTPARQLQAARGHAEHLARGVRPLPAHAPTDEAGPLHVAYLSSDLCEHATAHLIAEVIERHDRETFRVSAYDWSPEDGSPMRARLRRGFDRFVMIGELDDRQAAERIRADGVDVLIDLKGYTRHARTPILAYRAAPLQISWLGYPGSMGANFVDYLIADAYVIPPAQRAHYRERVLFLPDTYQPNDRLRAVGPPPSREAAGLPSAGFVFCAFHQPYKITPAVFEVWAGLLRAVEGSVLWLLEGNPWMAEGLRATASAAWLDPARLRFAPRCPAPEHLGRLSLADLFLDTWPVNGHTTVSEALWAGVPVVTLSGESFASRVGGSLLLAAGLPELVATSLEAYGKLAAAPAQDPARLARLRERVQRSRTESALFDCERFTRHLETAYQAIWQRWRQGLAPADLTVQASGSARSPEPVRQGG